MQNDSIILSHPERLKHSLTPSVPPHIFSKLVVQHKLPNLLSVDNELWCKVCPNMILSQYLKPKNHIESIYKRENYIHEDKDEYSYFSEKSRGQCIHNMKMFLNLTLFFIDFRETFHTLHTNYYFEHFLSSLPSAMEDSPPPIC